jgi:formate-dependent nitrite reductase membrane component NrfD
MNFTFILHLFTTIHCAALPKLQNLYYYMRTHWEHLVSHYMYAAGYACMSVCVVWAYRTFETPDNDSLSAVNQRLLWFAAIIYGVVIAGVGVNFPAGNEFKK